MDMANEAERAKWTHDVVLQMFIDGHPAPAGSKRAFVLKHGPRAGCAVVTDAGGDKTADWKRTVKHFVRDAHGGRDPETGPLGMFLTFYMARPKSHFGAGRNAAKLKPSAPLYHTQKPDTTKLIRAIEDAMSGIVWVDDVQIVRQEAVKAWTTGRPGATVTIWRMR